jgi:hypothetical protein
MSNSQNIIDALASMQAAITALIEQAATSGEWAARGHIYLNGYEIRGGHPDSPEVDKAIRLTGGPVELLPGVGGYSKILGIKTPQIIKRDLTGSLALTEADNGALLVSQHSAEDAPIVVTLPGLPPDYGQDPDGTVVLGGTFFVQVFHAGDGNVSFATPNTNQFLIAGVTSSNPVPVGPGKVSLAMYIGDGQWSVF